MYAEIWPFYCTLSLAGPSIGCTGGQKWCFGQTLTFFMRDLNSHRIAVRTSTLDRADVQPTTHRIAKVMANIRHRPPVAVVELTGPGLVTGPKLSNIFKNVKLYCQCFTPANDHANRGVRKHTPESSTPDFFRAPVGGEGMGIPMPSPQGTVKYIFLISRRVQKRVDHQTFPPEHSAAE